VITQHSFSVVPEGNPLRRRYTVTADLRWDEQDQRSYWVVRMDGGYVHHDLGLYDEPRLFEEQEALAVAEQAAGVVKLWTQYGDRDAYEAMGAGLR
jgi:hypothetical protein